MPKRQPRQKTQGRCAYCDIGFHAYRITKKYCTPEHRAQHHKELRAGIDRRAIIASQRGFCTICNRNPERLYVNAVVDEATGKKIAKAFCGDCHRKLSQEKFHRANPDAVGDGRLIGTFQNGFYIFSFEDIPDPAVPDFVDALLDELETEHRTVL